MKVKDTYKDFDEQFQVATLAGHTCWSSSFRPSRDNPVHFYLLANDDYCKLCVTLEYLRKRFREGIFAMICRHSGLDGYLRLFPGFPIFLGYSRNFENSAKPRRALEAWASHSVSGLLTSWKLAGPERLKNQAQFGSRIHRFGRRHQSLNLPRWLWMG